jgi:hypothetical protein
MPVGEAGLEGAMKSHALIVFLTLVTTGAHAFVQQGTAQTHPGQAQTTPAPASQPDAGGSTVFRPGAGTVIVAELNRSLDANKLRVNDRVECGLIQELLYKGKVVIPKDARVVGHVTEVVASTKEQPQSRLGLVFDKILLKDKKELPFQYPAAVVAFGPPITWSQVATTRMQDMPVRMTKGVSTGGAAVDAVEENPNLAGGNMRSTGRGALTAGNRGVIGMKGLSLETNSSELSTIVSAKGGVKLVMETQVVIRVTDPPKH